MYDVVQSGQRFQCHLSLCISVKWWLVELAVGPTKQKAISFRQVRQEKILSSLLTNGNNVSKTIDIHHLGWWAQKSLMTLPAQQECICLAIRITKKDKENLQSPQLLKHYKVLYLAKKYGLKLQHASYGEEDSRIIWNKRWTGQNFMLPSSIKL